MSDSDLSDTFLRCSCCVEPARLRPDIVWFGEMPMHMEAIYAAVDACEVFVVVGSSGHVYPAADLVHIAKANGARTCWSTLRRRSTSKRSMRCTLARPASCFQGSSKRGFRITND